MPRWTRIRSVDVHPKMWPSRELVRQGDGAAEVCAKQAEAIAVLYSMHLASVKPVAALTWWVRFIPVEDPQCAVSGFGDEPALVTWGDGEVFKVPMEATILDLPADERRRAYLDWLHSHLIRLAEARQWSTEGFEQAYAMCLADNARFRWRGATKASPNRRHTATPEYAFDDNGDCWTTLVVRNKVGDVVTEGGPWDCFPDLTFIKRSARSVRWETSAQVHIATWDADLAQAWHVSPAHTINIDTETASNQPSPTATSSGQPH